jgi:hypothetical protein
MCIPRIVVKKRLSKNPAVVPLQRLVKNITAATDRNATTELLDASYLRKVDDYFSQNFLFQFCFFRVIKNAYDSVRREV